MTELFYPVRPGRWRGRASADLLSETSLDDHLDSLQDTNHTLQMKTVQSDITCEKTFLLLHVFRHPFQFALKIKYIPIKLV